MVPAAGTTGLGWGGEGQPGTPQLVMVQGTVLLLRNVIELAVLERVPSLHTMIGGVAILRSPDFLSLRGAALLPYETMILGGVAIGQAGLGV